MTRNKLRVKAPKSGGTSELCVYEDIFRFSLTEFYKRPRYRKGI